MSPTKAELQQQVESLQGELEDARQRVAELETRLQNLAQANQRQADRIEALQVENRALQAQEASGPLMGAGLDAAGELEKLSSQNQDLEKQVGRLQAQLDVQGQTPALGAEQVGGLVRELYEQLSSSFPGLSVRGGQVTMKFRAQPLAGQGGFLLGSAGEQAADPSEVQEITLQFDRRGPSQP